MDWQGLSRLLSAQVDRIRTAFAVGLSVSAALLIGMVVVLLANIGSRQLQLSIFWMNELARIFTVWLVFLSLGYITLEGEHIKITYFADRLSRGGRRVVEGTALVACLLTTAFVFLATVMTIPRIAGGTTPLMGIPTSVFYVPLALGMALSAVAYGYLSVELLRRGDDPDE